MKIQLLATMGVLTITGCSTPHVVINAKANHPVPAKSSYLVMAAEEMEDFDGADRLMALPEQALRKQGYRSSGGMDADVVVLTRISSVLPSGKEAPLKPLKPSTSSTSAARFSDDSFRSVATLAMGYPDGITSMASENFRSAGPERTFEAVERLRLTVKAASIKDWMKPDATFESPAAIWMVTVEGPASQSQRNEFIEQAVSAASSYFAQNIETPQRRAISLSPSGRSHGFTVATHNEPDLMLDPLE
jgi:hypothetical protein